MHVLRLRGLYVCRIVNPAQLRALAGTAITTAIGEHGPTVISLPGDIAAADAAVALSAVSVRENQEH